MRGAFIAQSLLATGVFAFCAPTGFAQVSSDTPTQIQSGGVIVISPGAGTTNNLSTTSGTKVTLSVGNSTSFGAAANLSASSGVTAVARSVLEPSSVAINSEIGQNTLALTKIDIANLSSAGSGGTITPEGHVGTFDIAETGSNYASGNAIIEGMGAAVQMEISESSGNVGFFATVQPNTLDSAACFGTSGSNGEANSGACSFEQADTLVSGNAAGSANLSTQTNIDINSSNFTTVFAQSF